MSINILKEQKVRVKKLAVDLRKKGLSYSEIKKEILSVERSIFLPIATMSLWLKNVKLSTAQTKRLEGKRIDAIKRGGRNKTLETLDKIQKIRKESMDDIKKISKKELWLMGIILYWRERLLNHNDSDLQKGVRFTSSDPSLIKFFMRWLSDIGGLKKEEIGLDIFARKHRYNTKEKLINYWSKAINLPKSYFYDNANIYYQKTYSKKGIRRSSRYSQSGFLRIRVKASSMMARQISGWVYGIKREMGV